MAQRISKIEPMVQGILENFPKSRDSDEFLYYKVIQKYGLEHCNVGDFLLIRRSVYRVPPYETVGRVRRKLQADHPELRGSKVRQEERAEEEQNFKAYALSEVKTDG